MHASVVSLKFAAILKQDRLMQNAQMQVLRLAALAQDDNFCVMNLQLTTLEVVA
jgi:hypothetical protein